MRNCSFTEGFMVHAIGSAEMTPQVAFNGVASALLASIKKKK